MGVCFKACGSEGIKKYQEIYCTMVYNLRRVSCNLGQLLQKSEGIKINNGWTW